MTRPPPGSHAEACGALEGRQISLYRYKEANCRYPRKPRTRSVSQFSALHVAAAEVYEWTIVNCFVLGLDACSRFHNTYVSRLGQMQRHAHFEAL